MIPHFRKINFPLTCHSITGGLGERPNNPQADKHQLFVDQDRQNRAARGKFIMLLHNITAVSSPYAWVYDPCGSYDLSYFVH